MLRGVVVVFLVVSFSQAADEPKKDHNPVDSSSSSSTTSPPKTEAVDFKAKIRDGLRRLPDSGVLGLSQKIGQALANGGVLNADQLGKIVDGLPVNANQKAELKKTFGEAFPNLGNEGGNAFSQLVSDVVKERNLSATGSPTPTPAVRR